jgi:hypothetical protein
MTQTTKEEISHWDKILDEYENSLGLPTYMAESMPESELQNYLSMNRTDIEKLTPIDCAEISYRLAQYAFHIQRSINRELSRLNWVEENIKMVISEEINNYKGYGYIEKSYQAIKNNSRATSLQKVKVYAKQRSDRLSYIANNIKNLADTMINVQKAKVNHGNQ